jgi:hypothetical protein
MTERLQTDFLVADGSLLGGAGTVFYLGGNVFRYNHSGTSEGADARALYQDFAMIGQDIQDVATSLFHQDSAQLKLNLGCE